MVEILRGNSKNSFVHVHCMAGKGRTTTCMVFIDIFHNSQLVSLQTIAQRHAYHGGLYLNKVPTAPEKLWKTSMALDRWLMITRFYEYCSTRLGVCSGECGDSFMKFSDWLCWKEADAGLGKDCALLLSPGLGEGEEVVLEEKKI